VGGGGGGVLRHLIESWWILVLSLVLLFLFEILTFSLVLKQVQSLPRPPSRGSMAAIDTTMDRSISAESPQTRVSESLMMRKVPPLSGSLDF
jgi:hypothetical protein